MYNILCYDIEEKLLSFVNSIQLTISDLRKIVFEKQTEYERLNWFAKLFLCERTFFNYSNFQKYIDIRLALSKEGWEIYCRF